ncbi:TATA binding protein associated factor [Ceraceosorus bombacis]|uniref:Transcription initiation factor TFIID subunit 2 n=1 Tax=Ceraceosorus bombacis TaxID=401625 RepID=A0A0P1BA06_9BASI|nr:TATA binding protein associated factor [Ceraceosorus bombacis]
MARMPSRGFTVAHQKVALDLDLERHIASGYTELTVAPTDKALRVIHLNFKGPGIQRVLINAIAADYSFVDHTSDLTLSDPSNVHLYPELKRRLYAAASDGAGGELSILIPPTINLDSSSASTPIDASTPGGQTLDLPTLLVRVEYALVHPTEGLTFISPTPESPHRSPHLYLAPTCPDFARCWVPCVDSLWERCTWDIVLVVPSTLRHAAAAGQDEDVAIIALASGDLVEEVAHPHKASKSVFYFSQAVPTSVHHISIAAGPFVLYDVSSASHGAPHRTLQDSASKSQVPIHAYALVGRDGDLAPTTSTVLAAMDFYSRDYGSYPFASFSMVFVDEAPSNCHTTATLLVLSSDLLHPANVIEQALETRMVLHQALAFQWVGVNIIQRTWSDTWLVQALSLYLSGLFLRRLMGQNEYRFRLRKDVDKVCAADIGMAPLCVQGCMEPPDESYLTFMNLKAPLVLHILDRRLRKAGASLGLGRVIPRVLLQAITGELVGNTLSTSSFLRTCRKVSSVDLRAFAKQWIYSSGCPTFYCSAEFNRKKLIIEFNIRQESPAAIFAAQQPHEATSSNPSQVFEGQMTARIHEADGTPYEHVFDINAASKRIEVPFNTKYKRVRRNTKRFQARQAAAAAAAQGDQDAAEAMTLIDLGFSCSLWEDEAEREKWRVADWTEEDEKIMASAPHEWIRMDADFEWIANIHFDQPDFMWVSQLERDRDVVAQMSAINALAQLPNPVSCSTLTRTVLVEKYFFRVRMEAAHALINSAVEEQDYLGLFHLLMLFRRAFCHDIPADSRAVHGLRADRVDLDEPCIPKANDFGNIAEYFVGKAIIQAISRVRNVRGRTLPQVKRFLINLLRYNDNSTNRYADEFYIAGIIEALSAAFVPATSRLYGGFVPANEDPDARYDEELLLEARYEVERFRELDKLVPSFHNTITLAAIDFNLVLTLANLQPVDLPLFLAYTRQGSFAPVRTAAFEAMLLMRGLQHKVITRYIFAVLQTDESRSVKRALSNAMCEALAVSIATGDFTAASILDEGQAEPTELLALTRDEAVVESLLRPLRKDIGRSASVREGFLSALLSPAVDLQTRWALLRLAEMLFKPAEEHDVPFQPKLSLRVRVPSLATPAENSAAAPLPTPRIRIKTTSSDVLTSIAESSEVEDASSSSSATNMAQQQQQQPKVSFSALSAAAAAPTSSDSAAGTTAPLAVKIKRSSKPKKAKPVDVAQSSGMSPSDLTVCRSMIKDLFDDRRMGKHSAAFRLPVDPVRDGAPNYFDVIDDPMDLSSMRDKLNAGLYQNRFDFKADFDLMIRNAKTFTPSETAKVHRDAKALEQAFGKRWSAINKTIAQTEAKARGEKFVPTEAQASSATEPQAETMTIAAEPSTSTTVPEREDSPDEPLAAAGSGLARTLALTASSVPATDTPSTSAPKLGLKLKLKPKISKMASEDAGAGVSSAPVGVERDASATLLAAKGAEARGTTSPARFLSPAPSTSSTTHGTPTQSKKFSALDPVAAGSGEPVHFKQSKAMLGALKKRPEAHWFKDPVDANALPTYYQEVKAPMDLGTVERKLLHHEYKDMGQLAADVLLIVSNAHQFNGALSVVGQDASKLEKTFRKEFAEAMVRRLEEGDKRILAGVLSRLRAEPVAFLFLEPVDTTVYWHYFDIVKKEEARDLSLIGKKLKEGRYDSVDAFERDLQMMLDNCHKFNADNEEVLEFARTFEKVLQREMLGARNAISGGAASATKRKSAGSAASAAGNKRARP